MSSSALSSNSKEGELEIEFEIPGKETMPSASPPPPIRSLFVTLRRGLAGVRESHRAVVTDGLGLRKRERTVRISNNASNRGMIDKVRAERD